MFCFPFSLKHILWEFVNSLEVVLRSTCNLCTEEYLQSLLNDTNKKNTVYPCKPQFYYIKLRGSLITYAH